VDCYFGSGTLLSYARSGQVRVLATTSAKRDAAAPDVPTIAESGIANFEVTAWQALFVPVRTPAEIVRKISADTSTALADPAIRDKLAKSAYGGRLVARGARDAAQIGNRPLERRHRVGRAQGRMVCGAVAAVLTPRTAPCAT
jgi:Tripartite tricarboxylate transporter family receptor